MGKLPPGGAAGLRVVDGIEIYFKRRLRCRSIALLKRCLGCLGTEGAVLDTEEYQSDF